MKRIFILIIIVSLSIVANCQELTSYNNFFVKTITNVSSSINLTNPNGFWHLSAPRTQDFPINKMSFYWNPNQPPQGDESTYREIMTFTTTGNIGVGVSNPAHKLHVAGIIQGTDLWGVDGRNDYPSSLNLKNNRGFWHISGPRTQEDWGNNISIFWATGASKDSYIYNRKFTILENGNVGIGVNNPATRLHTNGSVYIPNGQSYWIGSNTDTGNRLRMHHNGSSAMIDYAPNLYFRSGTDTKVAFLANGNVGIGCTDPQTELDVNGRLTVRGSDFVLGTNDDRGNGTKTSNRALVHNYNDELYLNYEGDFEGGTVVGGERLLIQGRHSDGSPGWGVNSTAILNLGDQNCYIKNSWDAGFSIGVWQSSGVRDVIRIKNSGNVSIGDKISSNGYKLGVDGTIGAREVVVEIDSWADYVFSDTYKLRSLTEVENFVNQNKHLPDVPKGTEVEANGVGLGEMNRILLQKVEELTLYIIEQEKRISELENKAK